MNTRPRILLVEDDASIASALKKELQAEGHEVAVAVRGDEGLALALEQPYDVVITDLKMPGLSGLELIQRLHASKPKLPIIMITAFSTTETAIEATKQGAYDYLPKPFDMGEMLHLVAQSVASSRLMSEPLELGTAESAQPAIVGSCRAMQAIYKEIGRVAATSVTVLIRGETGTGKELVARAIYHHSDRAAQPFIAVNCAAIPETLLESELFGHERGSFTGAHARRIGRFEQANRGTIFLDEIGDLTPGTQVKLFRVLQEKCLQRVGGNEKIPVDVRVLAATHRDLEQAMKERVFREDLFYRLSSVTIALPPLRERREDIPDLVKYALQRAGTEVGVPSPSILPEVIDFLKAQPWPGNVRELENVVRHALLLARAYPVNLEHAQQAYARVQRPLPGSEQTIAAYMTELLNRARKGELPDARARMIEEMERELFTRAIELAKGNQARAARWLGVSRTTMREKLLHFGLHGASESVEEA